MSDEAQKVQGVTESEPNATASTTPMWLVGLLFVVFFGAAWSFDQRGGWFNKKLYPPYKSEDAVARFQPPPPDEDPLYARGKALFLLACSACHQASGAGLASGGIPPLANSEWVLAEGPNRIIRIVLDGVRGPIKVKGQQFGTAEMNPFRTFSDEDLASVLTYIRMSRDWKHNASPVTAAQVKAVREATADRSSQWTEAELLMVPEK